jgi:hypothetical protein
MSDEHGAMPIRPPHRPKVLVAPPTVSPPPAIHLAGERSVAQPLSGLRRAVVRPVVASLGNQSAE